MRYIITLLACLFLMGCCPDVPQGTMPTSVGQMPFEGSGEYKNVMLPCNCGGIIVYEPDSCPCFNKEDYPDLVESLNKTHDWFKGHTQLKLAPKYMGKYESITLECGCVLCVYVPDSCKCLEKKYPDLGTILKTNYNLANKYKEKG